MSHHSVFIGRRYFPYSEESQHVVDAEGIEVLAHLPQAAFPPGKVVFSHRIPIVCGEAPVLSVAGEIIGRCPGTGVEVEKFRMKMRIGAVGAHAYRKIAFKGYAFASGIGDFFAQLLVEVELNPLVVFFSVFVSFCAELRIFFKPESVFFIESSESTAFQIFFSGGGVGLFYEGGFFFEYAGVIHGRETVKFFLCFFKRCSLFYSQVL